MLSRQLSRTLSSPAFRRECSPLQLAEGLKAGQATSCCPHASLKNTRSSFCCNRCRCRRRLCCCRDQGRRALEMWGWLAYWTACGAVKSITSFAMQFVGMSMHSRRVCAVTRNTTRGCAPKGTSFPGTEKRHWQDAGLEAGPLLDWRSLDLRPLSTHWASICSGAQGAAAFVCSRPMAGDDLSVGGAWLDRGPHTPHLPAPKIAVDTARRLAEGFNKATGRVGSCARSSAAANARRSQ